MVWFGFHEIGFEWRGIDTRTNRVRILMVWFGLHPNMKKKKKKNNLSQWFGSYYLALNVEEQHRLC